MYEYCTNMINIAKQATYVDLYTSRVVLDYISPEMEVAFASPD